MEFKVTIEEIKEEQPEQKSGLVKNLFKGLWQSIKEIPQGLPMGRNPVIFSTIEQGLYQINPAVELGYMRKQFMEDQILRI